MAKLTEAVTANVNGVRSKASVTLEYHDDKPIDAQDLRLKVTTALTPPEGEPIKLQNRVRVPTTKSSLSLVFDDGLPAEGVARAISGDIASILTREMIDSITQAGGDAEQIRASVAGKVPGLASAIIEVLISKGLR